MAIVPINELYRDYVTDGVPESGFHKPVKADIRDTLTDKLASRTSTKVYVIGHSWVWTGYLPDRLQLLLGANFKVINAGVGGQTLAQIKARLPEAVTSFKDADYVVVLAQINSVLNDVSAASIQADLQGIYNDIKASNPETKVIACTDGPFKPYTTDTGAGGDDIAAFPGAWTSAKQTVLDNVNAWIMNSAINVDARVDLYSLLEDPATPDTMLRALRHDYFHPSYTAGVNAEADAILAAGNFVAVDGGRSVRAARNVTIDQDVTRDADMLFHAMGAGFEPTIIAPVSTRNGDGVQQGFNEYHAQWNTASSGWTVQAGDDGSLKFGRIGSGSFLGNILSLIQGARSVLIGGLHALSDGVGLRVSGTTFGGGAGVALDIGPNGSSGMDANVYASGGSAFGHYRVNGSQHTFQIGGTSVWNIGTEGTLQPTTDGGRNLGSPSLRVATVYAVTSTINTSDAEQKQDFGRLPTKHKKDNPNAIFLAALDTEQAFFRWKDAVAEKGQGARWHFGPTAQGFGDACLSRGVDPRALAAYCEDEIAQDGGVRTVYGLRLDQFDRLVSQARWMVYLGELDWEPLAK